jgi:hypothetical protein
MSDSLVTTHIMIHSSNLSAIQTWTTDNHVTVLTAIIGRGAQDPGDTEYIRMVVECNEELRAEMRLRFG